MSDQITFAHEECVGTCEDGEVVRYVVGHVIKTGEHAFSYAVICGISAETQYGDTFLRMARPMAHAHLVGTTCASHALTVEEYDVTLQSLLVRNEKPELHSGPMVMRHGPEPLGHYNKGQRLTIPETLADGIVLDTLRAAHDRKDDATGETIREGSEMFVARDGGRYSTQKVSIHRDCAILLAREAVGEAEYRRRARKAGTVYEPYPSKGAGV